MWTSTMDLDQKKVLLTQIVGRFYKDIYFSSYSPLQVQNLPRQSLPDNSWVRVRNRLSGICGSDLHLLYRGGGDLRTASAAMPNHTLFYPGHEVVGEVIEIGDDVQRIHVGDRVVLQWKPNCLTAGVQPICRSCATGNYNLCDHGAFVAPPALGGGWSEEMLLHEQQLFRVPSGLTDEQAVMLEPAAVAVHAVLRQLPQPGDRVLIIGAGTVGLLTQQIIRALVPQAEISVLARYTFQVEQATRQGANIIYPQDAYTGVQQATQAHVYSGLFGNRTLQGGFDIIYDTVGRRKNILQHTTLHHALRWIRTQGTIVMVGMSLQPMHVDLTPLWTQEITLLGSQAHGVEYWPTHSDHQASSFKVASELMIQGDIAPEQLITHHFAVNDYKHALLTATKKTESRAIKVVFDYSLLPASVVPNVRASAPRIRRQSTINFANEREEEQASVYAENRQETKNPYYAPNTSSGRKEIPSAQPHTKELAKSPKTPALEEDFDNDDTASALPAIAKHITRNSTPYSSASQPRMPAVPDTQMPPAIEQRTSAFMPTTPKHNDFYPSEREERDDSTQLISKADMIPHTETDLENDSDATVSVPRVVLSKYKESAREEQPLEDSSSASVDAYEVAPESRDETGVGAEEYPSETTVEEPSAPSEEDVYGSSEQVETVPASTSEEAIEAEEEFESAPENPVSTTVEPAIVEPVNLTIAPAIVEPVNPTVEPEPEELSSYALETEPEEPAHYVAEPESEDYSSYPVDSDPEDFSNYANYPGDVDAEFSHDVPDTFEPDMAYEDEKNEIDAFDLPQDEVDPEIPFVDGPATITSAEPFQSKAKQTYGQQRSRNRKKRSGGR